jgi:small subunit ribosomal protein S1
VTKFGEPIVVANDEDEFNEDEEWGFNEGPHSARVTEVTGELLLAELDDGTLVIVSKEDMRWTNQDFHPSQFFWIGQRVRLMVNRLSADESLFASIREAEQHPWSAFTQKYKRGSELPGKVTSVDRQGASLLLDMGIEGELLPRNISLAESPEVFLGKIEKGDWITTKIESFYEEDT